MNKIRRTGTTPVLEAYQNNLQFNKSPIRRSNLNQLNPNKSPIRSRTPTRDISPIKNTNPYPTPIKYISNVSPIKEKPTNLQNYPQLSNGKSVKYINCNINDKFYQTNKKDKPQDFNKKSERIMQDQNRLFGKLVDKLNSEKKNAPKSNQNSYKTSIFGDTSATKITRIEQTTMRQETVQMKQNLLFSKTPQSRSELKPPGRNRQSQFYEQEQNLSCLVYKMKSVSNRERDDIKPRAIQFSKGQQRVQHTNNPSILLKRKHSKYDEDSNKSVLNVTKNYGQIQEEEEDYGQLNIFLKKIQQGCKSNPKKKNEDIVKMSFKLEQSLSMEPFL